MTSDLSLQVKNSPDGQSDNNDNNATWSYLSFSLTLFVLTTENAIWGW